MRKCVCRGMISLFLFARPAGIAQVARMARPAGISQVARMARPAGNCQVALMAQTGLEPVDESHQPETSF